MAHAQDMSGGTPGSQAFLGALQDAITLFWNDLSTDDVDMYEEMARDWSENGPPHHIQSRQVTTGYSIIWLTQAISEWLLQ